MKKQESRLIEQVISLLPAEFYVEKTFNPLRRGTPDLYVEGPRGTIMWIECKWIPEPWTEPVAEICDSQSWPLQKRWLQRAKRNGIIVGVLIGIGNNEFCYGLEGPDFDFDPSINKPERLADIASIK